MVIVQKDLRDTFRTRAFYASLGMAVFVTVMLSLETGQEIKNITGVSAISTIQALLSTLSFFLCIMLMMLFCIYINAYTLTLEKVKHSIESLLCTPLSLKQICLGKTLAIFIPSLLLGWLFTFGSLIGINQIFIKPQFGQFILPGAAPLVAILVVVPLIIFFLSSIFINLQLIVGNIRWVNSALMAAVCMVSFGLSPILRFEPASWNIVFISLGVACILALAAYGISTKVSKESLNIHF